MLKPAALRLARQMSAKLGKGWKPGAYCFGDDTCDYYYAYVANGKIMIETCDGRFYRAWEEEFLGAVGEGRTAKSALRRMKMDERQVLFAGCGKGG